MRRVDRCLNKLILATTNFIGFQWEKTLFSPPVFHCAFDWRKGGIRIMPFRSEALYEVGFLQ